MRHATKGLRTQAGELTRIGRVHRALRAAGPRGLSVLELTLSAAVTDVYGAIRDLRALGLPVATEMVDSGNGIRHARYVLTEGDEEAGKAVVV